MESRERPGWREFSQYPDVKELLVRVNRTHGQLLVSLLSANGLSVIGEPDRLKDRVARVLVKSVFPDLNIPLFKSDFASGQLPATGLPVGLARSEVKDLLSLFEAGIAGLGNHGAPDADGVQHKVEVVVQRVSAQPTPTKASADNHLADGSSKLQSPAMLTSSVAPLKETVRTNISMENADKDVEMRVDAIHQSRNKSFIESVYGTGRWFRTFVSGGASADVDIRDRQLSSTPSRREKNEAIEESWDPDFALADGFVQSEKGPTKENEHGRSQKKL